MAKLSLESGHICMMIQILDKNLSDKIFPLTEFSKFLSDEFLSDKVCWSGSDKFVILTFHSSLYKQDTQVQLNT